LKTQLPVSVFVKIETATPNYVRLEYKLLSEIYKQEPRYYMLAGREAGDNEAKSRCLHLFIAKTLKRNFC
jgi:hypothetical protein